MKAILVECLTRQTASRMEEMSDIAKAAGYNVVDKVTQNRESIDPAYCVGEGKIEEISRTVEKDSVEIVIFTRQLSASQIFRIKKKVGGLPVLDRNLLILEIFEKRSATTEAKIQIELARLRYTFSWAREAIRSHGILGEQMGRGGPGQYPYEAHEAMARKRISKLEHELRNIRSRKVQLRERRGKAGFKIVALTGYTQSGKTTLFNRLTSESKEIGLGPFTTLSTLARKVFVSADENHSDSFIMIDSIGFIEDLNPLLLDAFHTTLNELANSDLTLLFVDGSDDLATVRRKLTASHEVMEKEVKGVPVLICINKVDITSREHLGEVLEEVHRIFGSGEILEISSKTGANVPELLLRIGDRLNAT